MSTQIYYHKNIALAFRIIIVHILFCVRLCLVFVTRNEKRLVKLKGAISAFA